MNADLDRAVIVGDSSDVHVSAVLDVLARRGAPVPLVLDAPRLQRVGFCLVDGVLSIEGVTASLGVGRGWLRRYAPSAWGAGSVAGSLDAATRRAFLSLVGSISRLGDRDWLTSLSTLLAAEDRLLQLEVAASLTINVPRTVVTSRADEAAECLGADFVVKPLSGGYYVAADGEPRAVFTSVVPMEELADLDFAAAPFVAQSCVRAEAHLRVVTVRDQAWVAALDASELPVDWRQHEEAHTSWEPADWPEVTDHALSLAAQLDIGYSSQDWIVGPDGPVLVDVNPAGQWLFLPEPIASSVTAAIASHLLNE